VLLVLRLTIMTRAGAEDDMDATLADNIQRKGARFREKDLNADDEYDFDGGIEMYESRKQKGTKVRETTSESPAKCNKALCATIHFLACISCKSAGASQGHAHLLLVSSCAKPLDVSCMPR